MPTSMSPATVPTSVSPAAVPATVSLGTVGVLPTIDTCHGEAMQDTSSDSEEDGVGYRELEVVLVITGLSRLLRVPLSLASQGSEEDVDSE